MRHIANSIFDLPFSERPAAPIGKASALVDGKTKPAFNKVGIADLFGLADRHHCDLRVKDGGGGRARQIVDNLHILTASVEDFEHIMIFRQKVEHGGQIQTLCQRIDRRCLFLIADLH